jgi:hypothetical protein
LAYYSPNQLKASKKLALASGCLCFIFLLFLSFFYHGIPSFESLVFILMGSSLVGLLGYYLGTVVYSNPKRLHRQKSNVAAQAVATSTISTNQEEATPPPPTNETVINDQQEEPLTVSQDQLQESIPEVADSHSEHEWIDTASIKETEEETESKAFEA